ncbi:MAG: DUF4923 family protein [Muribaculaceae bacterium]|nr:DUF4923 family protein [Muribaculaceae bacterium]
MKYKYIALGATILASSLTANAWDIFGILNKAGESLSNQQTGQTQQPETQQPSSNQQGFSLGSLFGGGSDSNSSITNALGDLANLADGIFSKDNLSVADIAGTWTVKGSAVSFQSDSFLQQAGGAAAATLIENKLDPYYQKYGFTGAKLTIDKDGTFTLKTKKLTLNGTVTVQTEEKGKPTQGGNFYFNFNTFGSNSLGSVNTYVTKGISGLEIMFDASKLRAILSAVASVTKAQLAQTATNLLNQYDGICIGFDLGPAK